MGGRADTGRELLCGRDHGGAGGGGPGGAAETVLGQKSEVGRQKSEVRRQILRMLAVGTWLSSVDWMVNFFFFGYRGLGVNFFSFDLLPFK
jgi:hypothetical protein